MKMKQRCNKQLHNSLSEKTIKDICCYRSLFGFAPENEHAFLIISSMNFNDFILRYFPKTDLFNIEFMNNDSSKKISEYDSIPFSKVDETIRLELLGDEEVVKSQEDQRKDLESRFSKLIEEGKKCFFNDSCYPSEQEVLAVFISNYFHTKPRQIMQTAALSLEVSNIPELATLIYSVITLLDKES